MVETYAVLDDGAQRTMILPTAVQQLQLSGEHETLALRTVQPDTTHLSSFKVTFEISPRDNPEKRYKVLGAFTASGLDLVEQSYPVQTLKRKYVHLRGVPLQPFHKDQREATQPAEAWYLPHHLVSHNNKSRLVFDCSFRHHGLSLNDQLLPGPTLGPSLLEVLLSSIRLQ